MNKTRPARNGTNSAWLAYARKAPTTGVYARSAVQVNQTFMAMNKANYSFGQWSLLGNIKCLVIDVVQGVH